LALIALVALSCARPRAEKRAQGTDPAAEIARDRPERLVVPLAGAGDGVFTLEEVAIERAELPHAAAPPPHVEPSAPRPGGGATLDLPPPPAEPGEPPAKSGPEAESPDARTLVPPIPRGAPGVASGGSGTRGTRPQGRVRHGWGLVTLDVRVDERGEVSDALLVETDADSLAVLAALDAASRLTYHPALLGGRPVAVWTRQRFEVERGGPRELRRARPKAGSGGPGEAR
jgi:hypothetical protein